MDMQYLPGGEMIFSRSDIEVVLPALENATQKKFNNSFSAEQRKYERLEKQIQCERKDLNQRLLLEKRDFVRTNLVLKERRELFSRRTARRKEREFEKHVEEEKYHPAEVQEKHPTIVNGDEKTQLPRSPYYFPPLYKHVEKDLKELQTTQLQMDLAKKEPVDVDAIKNCRYLRLRSAPEQNSKTEHSVFETKVEEKSPNSFDDNEPY